MDEPLAHHMVVRAMEERAGMDATTRFALALRHAVSGHLPHPRYREAAVARRLLGAGPGSIERSIADWMSTDLNPVVRAVTSLRSRANAVWGYNAYNSHAGLGARTSVGLDGDPRSTRRELLISAPDPELCAVGTLAALERVLAIVSKNGSREDPRAAGLLEVGRLLGVEASAAFQVAEALAGGAGEPVGVDAAARALGASRRSLQRRLSEEGTTFEGVRAAARIVAATDMLGTEAPMAEVAWACGFADLPHMARSIKASCGMTPSVLRAILRGGVEPEAELEPTARGFPPPAWRVDSTDIGASQGTMPPVLADARAPNRRDEE